MILGSLPSIARSRRVTSRPSSFGIITSRTQSAGRVSSASSSASAPSRARATE
jgi:hypothetical protein